MVPKPSPATEPGPQILLVLPDRLLATALAAALASHCPSILLAHCWDELEDHLATRPPEVVVTDLALEHVVLTAHLGQLAGAYPGTRFVVTTALPSSELAIGLLTSGVAAVVDRSMDAVAFGAALATLCREGRWPAGVGWSQAVLTPGRTPLHPVPFRGQQVLDMLFAGATHAEIATRLRMSVKSVERRVAELRRAYGVAPRMPGPWEQGHRGRPPAG